MQIAPTIHSDIGIQPSRLLMISGVTISQSQRSSDQQRPTPDYQVLIDTFHPDIIDIHTIRERMDPLLRLVEQRLGIQWAIAVCAFQNRKRYSAILATGEDIGLPLAFLAKSTRTHIPLIITCHNISTRRPTFFLKRLGVGSAVHTFQCLSQTQATMLKERSSISNDRIQMLYWHVDHEFFQPMPEVPIRAQICSAGMASRDYATLVTAVGGLDVDLKIAADSPWFTQELNITSGELPERVEARSYGNYAALRQLYAESQFVVVPLFDVNFSAGYTVILEAMAMGKPVIVTKIRQRDDFIIDGWNGLYVAPGNVAELRDRMRYLIEHPEEVRRMGENARKTIEERFTLSHFIERMHTAITGVIA